MERADVSTHFPYNLPPVPTSGPNPWNFQPPADHDWDEVEVGGKPHTRTRNLVDAADGQQAEQRALSYLYAYYHEDLHGAHATALEQPAAPGRWEVHVYTPIGA